jgi:hydroxymethylglutaryl-CoA reductase (NADPH)
MNLRNYKIVKDRRIAFEKELGVTLSNIGYYSLDENMAATRSCENMIGVTQIPLGIAGPLAISFLSPKNQELGTTNYFIPLATTEGALVASVNRGCKAITKSGGAQVSSYRVGATRGPVFKVRSLEENSQLFDFLMKNEDEMKKIAELTSQHLKFLSYDTKSTGLYRFVRFVFDTKDAMGLNMVTIATDAIVRFIEEKTGIRCVSLSGNFCVDKKASHLNFQNNRGIEVWAEAHILSSIVQSVLNTTPAAFVETWLAKCMVGSAMSGSMGFNAQFANVLSAVFIATGQDPAHVAECAIGMTTAEVTTAGDLYVSVYLPDLMVGTVGGGTGLATQKEALDLLGVAGPSAVRLSSSALSSLPKGSPSKTEGDGKNAEKFAEIIGAAVLAGEISLLASLSQGTLASAHQKFARDRR